MKENGPPRRVPSRATVSLTSTMAIRFAPFERFLASRMEMRSPLNSPIFFRARKGESVNNPLP